MAGKAWYKGHMETCLVVGKKMHRTHKPKCNYPMTKHGKPDCGRVRNARARAAQNNDTGAIMRGGWKKFAKRCGVK